MKEKLKSNKGITMQDLVIAIIAFTTMAGVIGTLMVSISKIQAETKLNSIAMSYAIQVLEDIDKISYEEVVNSMETRYQQKFNIPSNMHLNINVEEPYAQTNNNIIKKVSLEITFNVMKSEETIKIQKLKIKEGV